MTEGAAQQLSRKLLRTPGMSGDGILRAVRERRHAQHAL